MAQTGYTPIQLYYSSTTTNAPLAANLAYGELAINITDGKLFYKDNANAIQVIGWKVVPATAGGTGQTSYAVGDLLYANTTTTLAKLADVATGNALISGGVNTAPSWGKIGLTTHVSGTLPTANGGTNLTSFTANGIVYASSSSVLATGSDLTFSGTAVQINVASQVPYFIARTNADGSSSPQGGLQWYENNSGQVTASITGLRGGGAFNQTNMVFSTADGGANTERARLFSSGGFSIGNTTDPGAGGLNINGDGFFGGSTSNSRLNVKAKAGNRAMSVQRSNGDAYFYTDNDNAVSTGANGADTVLFINKITATSRSINAAGTLNASGADYAEYMTKADDFVIAKGDVCGVNADGKLTNVFVNSVSFVVKSTDPSFVGGDVWGNEEALGVITPQQPIRILDETEQRLVSEATEDEEVVYETVIVKAGDSDQEWAAKEAEYAADKAAFNLALEAARQKVDRVAFAGQVPVNIMGAVPGQYIVPVDNNGAIKPTAVDESNMTLAMYMKAVGKVIAIEPDGRAKIIVKTA